MKKYFFSSALLLTSSILLSCEKENLINIQPTDSIQSSPLKKSDKFCFTCINYSDFTVSSDSVTQGNVISIGWFNSPEAYGDVVELRGNGKRYLLNNPDTSSPGGNSGGTCLIPKYIPDGNYELRVFSDNDPSKFVTAPLNVSGGYTGQAVSTIRNPVEGIVPTVVQRGYPLRFTWDASRINAQNVRITFNVGEGFLNSVFLSNGEGFAYSPAGVNPAFTIPNTGSLSIPTSKSNFPKNGSYQITIEGINNTNTYDVSGFFTIVAEDPSM